MWTVIEQQIQAATGILFRLGEHQVVVGGSINQTYRLSAGQRSFFVKLNQASRVSMFEAEALGLQELALAQSIQVPKVICWGTASRNSYLVLEWIELAHPSGSGWLQMGRQLAKLHRNFSRSGFGWCQNNTIGDTPQLNPWTQDWAGFFTKSRIGYQLQLARDQGTCFAQSQQLLNTIPKLLGHNPRPSMIHGDLWSGNVGFSGAGNPVIFDPAVYYGDREADLAMTELFGGFPQEFYAGYQEVWPLDPGYAQRKVLYNLYHVLNHFNLFGGSYRAQSERMMQNVIAMG